MNSLSADMREVWKRLAASGTVIPALSIATKEEYPLFVQRRNARRANGFRWCTTPSAMQPERTWPVLWGIPEAERDKYMDDGKASVAGPEPLEILDSIPARAFNVLLVAGITSIQHLQYLNDEQLLRIKGFGKKSLFVTRWAQRQYESRSLREHD